MEIPQPPTISKNNIQRKQRSKTTKTPIGNGDATPPPPQTLSSKRKDDPLPPSVVSKYHIENGKVMPTSANVDPRPKTQAQALAARRKDMLAGCFWPKDGILDEDEWVGG